MKRALPILLAAVCSLALVIVPQQQPLAVMAQTAGFVEPFNGLPTSPQAYQNPNNWDIMLFGIDSRQPNVAQHGPSCEAPGFPYNSTNSHPFSTASQAVFQCNDHLMTSMGISGYGAVYMTPPAVVDFSSGPAVISWDMSTLRTSSRDWVYVTITPWDQHHEMPFLNTDQHIPPKNIKAELGGANTFLLKQNGAFDNSRLNQTDSFTTWNDVFHAQSMPSEESATRRDTFQITLDRNRISLCMPNYTYHDTQGRPIQPFCWAKDTALSEALDPAVWHDQAAVQFTHVTYNAEKACEDGALANGYVAGKRSGTVPETNPMAVEDQYGIVHNAYGDAHCPPNTWHWDNVTLTPAVLYGVIPSVPSDFTRSSASAATVTFASPAPAGSYLSFVSFGDTPQLQVSYDSGATWQAPRLQPGTSLAHPEAGENIFTSIPAGQQSIMVRGARGYWGSFEAQAFKILTPPQSMVAPTPTAVPLTSTPTLVPTSTPTTSSTSTPTVAATNTLTATLTPTATSVSTSTPTPTPLPMATATATPSVACRVNVEIDGIELGWQACLP